MTGLPYVTTVRVAVVSLQNLLKQSSEYVNSKWYFSVLYSYETRPLKTPHMQTH
jgi:hypothetical protein